MKIKKIIEELRNLDGSKITKEEYLELQEVVKKLENNVKDNISLSVFDHFKSINDSENLKQFIDIAGINSIEFYVFEDKYDRWCNVVYLNNSKTKESYAFEALASENDGVECVDDKIMKINNAGDEIFKDFLFDAIRKNHPENCDLIDELEEELDKNYEEIEANISNIIMKIGEYASDLGIYKTI